MADPSSNSVSPFKPPANAEEDVYAGDPIFMEHARGLHVQAKRLADTALAGGGGANQIGVASRIEALADEQIALVEEGDPRKVACANGCFFCCLQSVVASVPEIVCVANFIRGHWNEDQITALRERIEHYKIAVMPYVQGAQENPPRQPCPLLSEGSCSVWSARPLACRGFNSFNASACERRFKDAVVDTQVLGLWKQRAVGDAIGLGIYRAARDKNLWPDGCDLILGLEIALDHPDAAERYAAGEPIFNSAACRGAREWLDSQSPS